MAHRTRKAFAYLRSATADRDHELPIVRRPNAAQTTLSLSKVGACHGPALRQDRGMDAYMNQQQARCRAVPRHTASAGSDGKDTTTAFRLHRCHVASIKPCSRLHLHRLHTGQCKFCVQICDGRGGRCHTPTPVVGRIGGPFSLLTATVGCPAPQTSFRRHGLVDGARPHLGVPIPTGRAAGRGGHAPVRHDDGVGVPVEGDAKRDR
jgi:hypothetical protein